uniref:SECIS binding protein 2 n=1 Tax=Nomascus leucogenys TaxID=61853 RepID=A0A2I3G4T5_NOMLE
MAFGASTFPPQYLSSEITLHPYAYSPYTLDSTQNVYSVLGSQYHYNQPSCYQGFQTVKHRNENMCPLPQEMKALFKMVTISEQTGNPESLQKMYLPPNLSLNLPHWTFLNCKVQRTICQRYRSNPSGDLSTLPLPTFLF